MPLDWDKPIQFENGEPCHLVETCPEGFKQFGKRKSDDTYPTRMILRDNVEQPMAAIWFMHEDGKGSSAGYSVINKPDPV